MSWHQGQILDSREVDRLIAEVGSNPLPSTHQIGERVCLNILMPNKSYRAINAVIADVSFSCTDGVRYYLAMPIAPGLYVKSGPYRGWVTRPGESPDPDGGLVPASDIIHELDLDEPPSPPLKE